MNTTINCVQQWVHVISSIICFWRKGYLIYSSYMESMGNYASNKSPRRGNLYYWRRWMDGGHAGVLQLLYWRMPQSLSLAERRRTPSTANHSTRTQCTSQSQRVPSCDVKSITLKRPFMHIQRIWILTNNFDNNNRLEYSLVSIIIDILSKFVYKQIFNLNITNDPLWTRNI